jgi:hypothetical protein
VRKEDSLRSFAKAGSKSSEMFCVRKCGELTHDKMSQFLAGFLLNISVCLTEMDDFSMPFMPKKQEVA